MRDFIIKNKDGKKTSYKVSDESVFFESINRWISEDKTETTLQVLVDSDKNMVLVDTEYMTENRIVLGILAFGSGGAILFSSEDEIRQFISANIDHPEMIILKFPEVIH